MPNPTANALSDQSVSATVPQSYALSDWLDIYQGISHCVGASTCAFGLPNHPKQRLQRVNVLRVDLLAPGIDFYISAQKDGDNGRTAGQTVTDFMRNSPTVRVAINANFTSTSPNYAQISCDHAAFGMVVSQGKIVCDPTRQSWTYPDGKTTVPNVPDSQYAGAIALLIRKNRSAPRFSAVFDVVTAHSQVKMDEVYAAVAGSARSAEAGWEPRKTILPDLLCLVQNGRNVCKPEMSTYEEVAARTGIGIQGQYLYLVTIEGREQSSGSVEHGAKLYDLAEWMMALKVDDAISLDGGGSTVMAKYDACTDQYVLLTTPYGDEKTPGAQRVVGVYFGVVAAGL